MSGVLAQYTVEVQFGSFFGIPTWVDVSPWVDLVGGRIEITRGRADEAGAVSPARLTVGLINDDGRFTPDNPASPYYPYVLDGAPVRCTVRVPAPDGNLEDNPSHEGGISEWQPGGVGTAPAIDQRVYGGSVGSGGENALVVTWATQASSSLVQRRIFGLTPGTQYTWSRRVYTATGGPNPFLTVGDGGLLVSGTAQTTKNAWATVQVTFVATQQSHILQLQVASSAAGGVTWTDNGRGDVGAVALNFTSDKVGARKLDRFTGNALEWPTGWDGGPALTANTQLLALGITVRLDDRFRSLYPFDVEEALLDNPIALLPLSESDGATQAGNLGSDQRAAGLLNPGGGGTVEFGSGTGPGADGSGSVVLTPAGTNSGFYFRAPTSLFSNAATLEAFVNTTVSGGVILDAAIPKNGDPNVGQGFTLRTQPGTGKLQWNSDGGNLVVTGTASVCDGQTHHVAAVYRQTGTQHIATLYVDGVQVGTGATSNAWVLVRADWWLVGGASKLQLFAGTINHAGLYPTALTADRILAHALAGLTGFGGERSDQRISRLASYAGLAGLTPALRPGVWLLDSSSQSVLDSTTILAATDIDVGSGSSRIWGQAGGGMTPLSGMSDVAATEGGTVTEDRSGSLTFLPRTSRYNRAPVVRLDLDDADIQPDLQRAFDDSDVVNDATYATQDGAQVRYLDPASVGQRGTYGDERTLLTRDAADVFSAASWRVNRHTRPRGRYRSVTVDLTTASRDKLIAVLGADLSDRIDLIGLPSQVTSTAQLFVEGYTETVDADGLVITFNTSSADGYQVWTLDNPTLSVLDTTTVLAW